MDSSDGNDDQASARSKLVLIVEDEPILLMHAIDIVESAGFQAITATNADAALRILENRSDVRLVFTDIDMPGSMDGMKLAASIRDRWPPIALIVTSGKVNLRDQDLPTGGRFFSKPYRTEAVVSALRDMAA